MNVDPWTHSKLTPAHQAKLAYVYIRQSSLSQVLRHGESTELQYRLVERAVDLGWPRERVHIIDDDLGKSGASSAERQGFQLLIAEVGLGRVGLVLSFDASRLARNNSDWSRLIDLCSLFGVLIADGEHLYDPHLYHDRLLLGLTGIMSEAELHHLKRRMHAGARQKAERGAPQHPLPVGLLRQRDGSVILNPDEEVQARLRLIFAKFDELGSARAVRAYLVQEQLRIPARPPRGPAPHDTVWTLPKRSTILRILHNPAYAGAYVHGQRMFDPARHCIVEVPIEQWPICIQNVYPAYISWETYLANRKHLLRLVLKEVIADQRRLPGKLWFQLNWQTGASSVHEFVRYGVSYRHYIDGERIEARIRHLSAAHQTDKQIASTLNAEGYRTTRGGLFRPQTIWHLRKGWGLASIKMGEMTADGLRWTDGTYTIRGVMQAVGVSKDTVHRWRHQGRIQGSRHGPALPWRFKLTPEQIRTLRAQVKRK